MTAQPAWPDCLDHIAQSETLPELATRVLGAAGQFGLTVGASGIVAGQGAAGAQRFHFAVWPPGVLERYMADNLIADDPGPRWARATGTPATWREIERRLPPADPGRRVMRVIQEFGITEGVAVPMRAADGALGFISLGGKRPPIQPSEFRKLVAIATIGFRTAEEIDLSSEAARAAPVLTEREVALLPFLVHGHGDKQIATLMGISEPTVRFHLKNLRAKLAAVSRTHLAAKAVAFGYVTV